VRGDFTKKFGCAFVRGVLLHGTSVMGNLAEPASDVRCECPHNHSNTSVQVVLRNIDLSHPIYPKPSNVPEVLIDGRIDSIAD
jgi:hypothetical protein